MSSVRTDSAPELLPTVRAAALARPGAAFEVTAGPAARLRRGREANLIVLLLDTSGSMAARRRGRAVATTALSLLGDAYRRRDRVALLTFRGEAATVVVPRPGRPSWPPGGCATFRSAAAPARGRAEAVQRLVRREAWRDPARRPLLVVVTDGRATGDEDALAQARRAAARSPAPAPRASWSTPRTAGPPRAGRRPGPAPKSWSPCPTWPRRSDSPELAGQRLADIIRAKEVA